MGLSEVNGLRGVGPHAIPHHHVEPLIESFPPAGLAWRLAGGDACTLGAACHFVAIYGWVLTRGG
jgi:hypothetical protein